MPPAEDGGEEEEFFGECAFEGAAVEVTCAEGFGCACIGEEAISDPERFRIVKGLLDGTLMYRGGLLREVAQAASVDAYADPEGADRA